MVEIKKLNKDNEIVNGEKVVEAVTKTSNTSIPEKKSKKVFISIDTNIENIVQYQNEGYTLYFDDSDEEFKRLSEDEVKQLNAHNKHKYRLAKSIKDKTLRLDEVRDGHKIFKPRPNFASATDRLEIRGGDPNEHYFWKRPDELQRVAYEGGQICKDPTVQTFGGTDENGRTLAGSTVHKVSANGEDELILCQTSKESNDSRMKGIEMKSQNRNAAIDKAAANEIAKLGGTAKDFS